MRRYVWLTVFAVAMAYLEAAVVVYLRLLYYPGGFTFPLVIIPGSQALIEIGREIATLIMLWAAGRLGTRGGWPGFAGFMFVFGVWDIFYYVWLKALLGWPASLLTWDVLFLVPVPWIAPVLAPILVSLSLIGAAVASEILGARGRPLRASVGEWLGVAAAGLLVILSFTWDAKEIVGGRVPTDFRWALFAVGEALALALLVRGLRAALARPRVEGPLHG